MENSQIKKSTDAQKKASRKYENSKWRPSVFLDKALQPDIENHYKSKGYKSFNEYVTALVIADMIKDGHTPPNSAE